GVELFTGFAQNVALSPDGTRVVFVGDLGGVRQLYMRRLDQFDAVAIRGTEGATQCFFSPDGLAVGFISKDGSLKKASLSDRPVVILYHDGDVNASAVWGTNDRVIYERAGALWQVPVSGGASQQLTKLRDGHEVRHGWPAAIPGGQTILFTAVT